MTINLAEYIWKDVGQSMWLIFLSNFNGSGTKSCKSEKFEPNLRSFTLQQNFKGKLELKTVIQLVYGFAVVLQLVYGSNLHFFF